MLVIRENRVFKFLTCLIRATRKLYSTQCGQSAYVKNGVRLAIFFLQTLKICLNAARINTVSEIFHIHV